MLHSSQVIQSVLKALKKVFSGRWIGEGPLVDLFEKKFADKFTKNLPCVAVGS